MPELDTQVPAWLQQNWARREPFDVTPWLQARYQRQVQQAQLPLQLQGMALQNQAAQLAIQHQGLVNDLQNLQMQQYRDEQPRLQELATQYANDPVALMNHVENFTSPVAQKQWLDLQTQAARTQAGLAAIEGGKQRWIAARELLTSPGVTGDPELAQMKLDATGNPDPAWIAAANAAKTAYAERVAAERYGWHYDKLGNPINIVPQVSTLDVAGRKVAVVYNPKTGAFHPVSQLTHGSDADRAEIAIARARIAQLYKQHDEIPQDVGATTSHANTVTRMRIMTEISRLRDHIRELGGSTPREDASAPAADFQFTPGKGIVPVAPATDEPADTEPPPE